MYEKKLIRKLTRVISIEDEEEIAKERTRRKKIKVEGDSKGGDKP